MIPCLAFLLAGILGSVPKQPAVPQQQAVPRVQQDDAWGFPKYDEKDKAHYISGGYCGFGEIVGNAGDVNTDGVPDFILGDNGIEGQIPPALWVVSGKDGSVLRLIMVPDGIHIHHVEAGGDVDGDGVPDLLVVTSRDGMRPGPALHLISGKTGKVLHAVVLTDWPEVRGLYARFIGDFDHDGVVDVGALRIGPKKTKELTIYSGRTGAEITYLSVANECGDSWGGFIDAGDVDGDGSNDFAIVTSGDLTHHSAVRLYSVAKKTMLWEHLAATMGGRACGQLALIGDLDGDKVPELAVSFYDCVDVVRGKTGESLFHFAPKDKGDSEMQYGEALVALGDINNDGVRDFAIAETEAGAFQGVVRAMSGKDGKAIWETPTLCDSSLYHFGSQVAALGDIDGDGITDLVVATNEIPSGQPGVALVISGNSGAILYKFYRHGDDLNVIKNFTRQNPK